MTDTKFGAGRAVRNWISNSSGIKPSGNSRSAGDIRSPVPFWESPEMIRPMAALLDLLFRGVHFRSGRPRWGAAI
jgi:hypothetical protein